MKRFYLGIGVPRSGTTWLYRNLRNHTNLYVPPVKELRYFCATRSPQEKADQAARILAEPDLSKDDKGFTERWRDTKDGDWSDYLGLFPDRPLIGEISPIYCTLNDTRVGRIANLLSNLDPRVFMVMRNPYHRDISHVQFSMHRQRGASEAHDIDDYLAYVRAPAFRRRSDYDRTIEIWRRHFGHELNLYYFDDLTRDPEAFFDRFVLELDLRKTEDKMRTAKVNASSNKKNPAPRLPKKLLKLLRRRSLKRIGEMTLIDDKIKQSWITELEALDL